MWRGKVCLMQRTTYSVSDSVSSSGRFADLKSGPSCANCGIAASCSANGNPRSQRQRHRHRRRRHGNRFADTDTETCLQVAYSTESSRVSSRRTLKSESSLESPVEMSSQVASQVVIIMNIPRCSTHTRWNCVLLAI